MIGWGGRYGRLTWRLPAAMIPTTSQVLAALCTQVGILQSQHFVPWLLLKGKLGGSSQWVSVVDKSPKDRVVGPFPNSLYGFICLINGGDPNHLLTGMILQESAGGETFVGHWNLGGGWIHGEDFFQQNHRFHAQEKHGSKGSKCRWIQLDGC